MKRILLAMSVAAVVSTNAIGATGVPLNTQGIYFELGGGDTLRDTLNASPVLDIGINANLNFPRNCDLWDGFHMSLAAYESMVVDHIEDEIRALPQAIVTSMLGAVQGYATAALQRAMPGMYDWAMNINAQLGGKINVAKMSCETALRDVNAGNNPLDGWVKASGAFDWMNSLNNAKDLVLGEAELEDPPQILDAQSTAATRTGEADLPWLTGMAGGESEEPILLVNDTVVAGYALQAGGGDLAEAGITANQDVQYARVGGDYDERGQRLGELWGTAQAAANWATDVLGERTVSFCAECAGSTKAGKGLGYAAHEEKNDVLEAWTNIFDEGDIRYATIGQLRTVSSSKVQITQDVMVALANLPIQDRNLFIGRLASDVGTYRAVEKALAMRRLLQSSLTTPEVQAQPEAEEEVQALITELRAEIEDFVFEIETSKRLVSDVPAALIALRDATTARSVGVTYNEPSAARPTRLRGTTAEQ